MPRLKSRFRRRRRRSLTVISAFLIASAVLRIGLSANQAVAKSDSKAPSDHSQNLSVENCTPPPEISTVLKALNSREKRLDHSEATLRDRMQALSVAETVIEKKLAELVAAEARLQSSIAQAETASENDISKLTSVYENMKPQDAAALFEEMDPEFAAGFLSRMKPSIAAGIMAGLAPSTAYSLSVVLAGRNANVPTE